VLPSAVLVGSVSGGGKKKREMEKEEGKCPCKSNTPLEEDGSEVDGRLLRINSITLHQPGGEKKGKGRERKRRRGSMPINLAN